MAIDYRGRIFMWGCGTPLGREQIVFKPVQIKTTGKKIPRFTDVAGHSNHCLALSDHGEVYTIGNQKSGGLGRGLFGDKLESKLSVIPMTAFCNEPVVSIGCGQYFSAAVTEESNLYLWGTNSSHVISNKLADGLIVARPVHRHTQLESISTVSCGANHIAVLSRCCDLDGQAAEPALLEAEDYVDERQLLPWQTVCHTADMPHLSVLAVENELLSSTPAFPAWREMVFVPPPAPAIELVLPTAPVTPWEAAARNNSYPAAHSGDSTADCIATAASTPSATAPGTALSTTAALSTTTAAAAAGPQSVGGFVETDECDSWQSTLLSSAFKLPPAKAETLEERRARVLSQFIPGYSPPTRKVCKSPPPPILEIAKPRPLNDPLSSASCVSMFGVTSHPFFDRPPPQRRRSYSPPSYNSSYYGNTTSSSRVRTFSRPVYTSKSSSLSGASSSLTSKSSSLGEASSFLPSLSTDADVTNTSTHAGVTKASTHAGVTKTSSSAKAQTARPKTSYLARRRRPELHLKQTTEPEPVPPRPNPPCTSVPSWLHHPYLFLTKKPEQNQVPAPPAGCQPTASSSCPNLPKPHLNECYEQNLLVYTSLQATSLSHVPGLELNQTAELGPPYQTHPSQPPDPLLKPTSDTDLQHSGHQSTTFSSGTGSNDDLSSIPSQQPTTTTPPARASCLKQRSDTDLLHRSSHQSTAFPFPTRSNEDLSSMSSQHKNTSSPKPLRSCLKQRSDTDLLHRSSHQSASNLSLTHSSEDLSSLHSQQPTTALTQPRASCLKQRSDTDLLREPSQHPALQKAASDPVRRRVRFRSPSPDDQHSNMFGQDTQSLQEKIELYMNKNRKLYGSQPSRPSMRRKRSTTSTRTSADEMTSSNSHPSAHDVRRHRSKAASNKMPGAEVNSMNIGPSAHDVRRHRSKAASNHTSAPKVNSVIIEPCRQDVRQHRSKAASKQMPGAEVNSVNIDSSPQDVRRHRSKAASNHASGAEVNSVKTELSPQGVHRQRSKTESRRMSATADPANTHNRPSSPGVRRQRSKSLCINVLGEDILVEDILMTLPGWRQRLNGDPNNEFPEEGAELTIADVRRILFPYHDFDTDVSELASREVSERARSREEEKRRKRRDRAPSPDEESWNKPEEDVSKLPPRIRMLVEARRSMLKSHPLVLHPADKGSYRYMVIPDKSTAAAPLPLTTPHHQSLATADRSKSTAAAPPPLTTPQHQQPTAPTDGLTSTTEAPQPLTTPHHQPTATADGLKSTTAAPASVMPPHHQPTATTDTPISSPAAVAPPAQPQVAASCHKSSVTLETTDKLKSTTAAPPPMAASDQPMTTPDSIMAISTPAMTVQDSHVASLAPRCDCHIEPPVPPMASSAPNLVPPNPLVASSAPNLGPPNPLIASANAMTSYNTLVSSSGQSPPPPEPSRRRMKPGVIISSHLTASEIENLPLSDASSEMPEIPLGALSDSSSMTSAELSPSVVALKARLARLKPLMDSVVKSPSTSSNLPAAIPTAAPRERLKASSNPPTASLAPATAPRRQRLSATTSSTPPSQPSLPQREQRTASPESMMLLPESMMVSSQATPGSIEPPLMAWHNSPLESRKLPIAPQEPGISLPAPPTESLPLSMTSIKTSMTSSGFTKPSPGSPMAAQELSKTTREPSSYARPSGMLEQPVTASQGSQSPCVELSTAGNDVLEVVRPQPGRQSAASSQTLVPRSRSRSSANFQPHDKSPSPLPEANRWSPVDLWENTGVYALDRIEYPGGGGGTFRSVTTLPPSTYDRLPGAPNQINARGKRPAPRVASRAGTPTAARVVTGYDDDDDDDDDADDDDADDSAGVDHKYYKRPARPAKSAYSQISEIFPDSQTTETGPRVKSASVPGLRKAFHDFNLESIEDDEEDIGPASTPEPERSDSGKRRSKGLRQSRSLTKLGKHLLSRSSSRRTTATHEINELTEGTARKDPNRPKRSRRHPAPLELPDSGCSSDEPRKTKLQMKELATGQPKSQIRQHVRLQQALAELDIPGGKHPTDAKGKSHQLDELSLRTSQNAEKLSFSTQKPSRSLDLIMSSPSLEATAGRHEISELSLADRRKAVRQHRKRKSTLAALNVPAAASSADYADVGQQSELQELNIKARHRERRRMSPRSSSLSDLAAGGGALTGKNAESRLSEAMPHPGSDRLAKPSKRRGHGDDTPAASKNGSVLVWDVKQQRPRLFVNEVEQAVGSERLQSFLFQGSVPLRILDRHGNLREGDMDQIVQFIMSWLAAEKAAVCGRKIKQVHLSIPEKEPWSKIAERLFESKE
ncbi:mucin-5AC-like [Sycon ciliatum]|uniref:mucin-5AC-like n=1 Tax=Sycon ciliatum TaxID=27933 RepID=UPI0031F6C07C